MKRPNVRARGAEGQGVAFYPLAQELALGVAAARRARRLNALLRQVVERYSGARALEMIAALEREFVKTSFAPELAKAGGAVDTFTTAATARAVAEAVAVDPRRVRDLLTGRPLDDLLSDWTRAGAGLIKGIDETQAAEVARLVKNAQASGLGADALAEQIAARGNVAQSRARLIARDQVGKLNGEIAQRRQTSLGIVEYTWQTANDERVRPLHKARQGKVFKWAEPPEDGKPGEAINCRCVARPIVPEEIDLFSED